VYDWRGTLEHLDVPSLVAFAGSPGSMTVGPLKLNGTGGARVGEP
jgi:hypothetical protein